MTTQLINRGVPAVVLRVAILVVGVAIVVVPLTEGTTIGSLVVLLPAVLVSVYAPASPAPAGVVIAAAVLVALGEGGALRPEVLALIPLVHLFHVVCGIAGFVPARGRVHLAALKAPALRFVLVQAVVFALALGAALLPEDRVAVPFEVLGLVGLAALTGLVVRLHRAR